MKISLGVLLGVLFSFTSHAGPNNNNKFTVAVSVVGVATNELTSFLTRELREFSDVTVAEPGMADYEISIVSVQTTTAGNPSGYALSFVATSRIPADAWPIMVSNSNDVSIVQSATAELRTIEIQQVKVSPPDSLKLCCQEIVAVLDRIVLERQRQLFRQMQEAASHGTNAPSKRVDHSHSL